MMVMMMVVAMTMVIAMVLMMIMVVVTTVMNVVMVVVTATMMVVGIDILSSDGRYGYGSKRAVVTVDTAIGRSDWSIVSR